MAANHLLKEELHASVSDPVLDTMNFLNGITHRYPEAVSFAPGRPYDGFFDTEEIFEHIRRYLDHLAKTGYTPGEIRDAVFQYGPTHGQIRELIADSLRKDEDIDVPPEAIVVTVGCQEAMLLTLRALMASRDDVLLVASPCYVGITGAARLLDIALTPVEERADGLHCDDVEAAIRAERARGRRPRALYVVPDHSNPSGVTLSAEARRGSSNSPPEKTSSCWRTARTGWSARAGSSPRSSPSTVTAASSTSARTPRRSSRAHGWASPSRTRSSSTETAPPVCWWTRSPRSRAWCR